MFEPQQSQPELQHSLCFRSVVPVQTPLRDVPRRRRCNFTEQPQPALLGSDNCSQNFRLLSLTQIIVPASFCNGMNLSLNAINDGQRRDNSPEPVMHQPREMPDLQRRLTLTYFAQSRLPDLPCLAFHQMYFLSRQIDRQRGRLCALCLLWGPANN